MIKSFFNFMTDEEDQDPSFIRLTRNILLFVIFANTAVLALITGVNGGVARNPITFLALTVTLGLEVISLFYVYRGRIRMAKLVVPLALIIALAVVALSSNGLKSVAITTMPVVMIVAALLLGERSIILTTPLIVTALIVISIRDLSGQIRYAPTGVDDAVILPVLIATAGGMLHLIIRRLNESIIRAQESERVQREENVELTALRTSLEERVHQRTSELELANRLNERRARQFKAVTSVMNIVSTIQELDILLPRVTQVISEQFEIYHAGIFLLDSSRKYAVLRAANSEGGQKMLVRGHKLQVGQTGIVGFVTATGQPRIALDVGTDAVFFDNPDLPNTHSEIALPLQFAGQIIGALDVQSTEANAFNDDDIDALATLANQVAVAINNANTIEQAQRSLSEAQSALGETTREAWQVLRPKTIGLGLQLTETSVKPLEEPLEGSHVQDALKKGRMALATDQQNRSSLAIPIRLRDQVIGVMQINPRGRNSLSDDDTDIAVAVAQRLSLAIESATLLQSTQQRADIERVTTDITTRISSSTRFETILQTAAQELSRALGGSDVLVQIEPVALELSIENQ